MKRYWLAAVAWAALANPSLAEASTTGQALNGAWKFEYSCTGATGIYADRCAAGERDNFTLSIAQGSRGFCGWYEATVQMGNHVDDGDLSDWTFTPTTSQTFHVHFHLSGMVGEAVVRVVGNQLQWDVLTEQRHAESEPGTWSFSPPKKAFLVRLPADQVRHPAACQ